jgi:hypothetical protein
MAVYYQYCLPTHLKEFLSLIMYLCYKFILSHARHDFYAHVSKLPNNGVEGVWVLKVIAT